MLLSTDPLLAASDDLARGAHHTFAVVRSHVTQRTDGIVETHLSAGCEHGVLSVMCSHDGGAVGALITARELGEAQPWLPGDERGVLTVQAVWTSPATDDQEDVDHDGLLRAAGRLAVCGPDAYAWVTESLQSTSRQALLGGHGPSRTVRVGVEDELGFAAVFARDWERYARELRDHADRLAAQLRV